MGARSARAVLGGTHHRRHPRGRRLQGHREQARRLGRSSLPKSLCTATERLPVLGAGEGVGLLWSRRSARVALRDRWNRGPSGYKGRREVMEGLKVKLSKLASIATAC